VWEPPPPQGQAPAAQTMPLLFLLKGRIGQGQVNLRSTIPASAVEPRRTRWSGSQPLSRRAESEDEHICTEPLPLRLPKGLCPGFDCQLNSQTSRRADDGNQT
jgi:hypothetical protein